MASFALSKIEKMRRNKILLWACLILLSLASAEAATLKGSIYDLDLNQVSDVLIEINTNPKQQYLAKTGEYSLQVPEGSYLLKAKKGELSSEEEIEIASDGEFVFDLFLLPNFEEEDEIIAETGAVRIEEEKEAKGFFARYPLRSYLIALGIILIALGRIWLAKKKYKKNRREAKEEPAALKEEILEDKLKETEEAASPKYLEEAIELIKKYDGRIFQKQLRKEMLHLSEAKISLILTELEHKGRIEKIKRGRGNVIILKNSN